MKTTIKRDIRVALRIDDKTLVELYNLLKTFEVKRDYGGDFLYFTMTHMGGEKLKLRVSMT